MIKANRKTITFTLQYSKQIKYENQEKFKPLSTTARFEPESFRSSSRPLDPSSTNPNCQTSLSNLYLQCTSDARSLVTCVIFNLCWTDNIVLVNLHCWGNPFLIIYFGLRFILVFNNKIEILVDSRFTCKWILTFILKLGTEQIIIVNIYCQFSIPTYIF